MGGRMNVEQLFASFKNALGAAYLEDRTIERKVGTVDPGTVYDLWITVERAALHDAVAHLCSEYTPHLSVISGDDLGENVALNYHFTIGWGERYGEVTFTIRTRLPKSDLSIPTITDLLGGAQTSER